MVTIALGGDTMLGRMVGEELAHRPPASVWDPELLDVFREADCAIVNLECCISERGETRLAPGRPFAFRAPPRAVEALEAAGVRAVWLANNHALDFGEDALLDTFRYLESSEIAWAGAGRDLSQARQGATITAHDVRIGLIGLADHPADDAATADRPGIAWVGSDELARHGPPDWLLAEVGRQAATCDVVIVGPHWGPNMHLRPQAHHPAVARAMVAAGASAITGHSAHVVQPIDVVDGAPVCYDLGDLLDDYAVDSELRNDLGILALLTPGERLELIPLRLEYTRTRLATGDDHALIVERLLTPARRASIDLRLVSGRLVLDLSGPAGPGAGGRVIGQRGHHVLPHTADTGISATASTLAGLFEEAASAFGELVADIASDVAPSVWLDVALEGDDLPGLAYAWLSELVTLGDVHRSAVVASDIREIDEPAAGGPDRWKLRGRVGLRRYGGPGVRIRRDVKAATYHGLVVERVGRSWTMQAYLDI